LCQRERRSRAPPNALVIVIDRSGSMRGPRLDAAKQAAQAAISQTHPDDMVSVVAFDTEATVVVRPQRSRNRTQIAKELAKLDSGGGTSIFPGLKEAHEILANLVATKKHVMLSDGEAPADGIIDFVTDMHTAKETVSTVAVDGADEQLLKDIRMAGGGRMHKVSDLKQMSAIFVKETKVALK
jgi:Mg-chelatase subunit ChlD